MQKLRYGLLLLAVMRCWDCAAELDTTYVERYPHRLQVTAFTARNFLEMVEFDKTYTPNNPISIGLGFAVRNSMIGFYYGFGIIPIPYGEGGQTQTIDLQYHHYGQWIVVDLAFQQYKGFFFDDAFYSELLVRRYSAAATYLFNEDKFSAKAAFEQTERQRKSAGSFMLGAGVNYSEIKQGQNILEEWSGNIHNLQIGANVGYGYSWVINRQWLMSGMITVGGAVGNEVNQLSIPKIHLYPAASARLAVSYNRPSWSLAISALYNFNWLTSDDQLFTRPNVRIADNQLALRSGYVQLSFVKRFRGLKIWKTSQW
ncbi:hypothetical protein FACS1894156_6240 [Bacteroidia bacterium]|nr:hypothetical protein FACS1894156_6240 [Bacteroidia bacterium]